MHGESTQALSSQQAVQRVRCGCPSRRPLAFGEAFEDSRIDGEANKGLAARRTVRHGQTVIAR